MIKKMIFTIPVVLMACSGQPDQGAGFGTPSAASAASAQSTSTASTSSQRDPNQAVRTIGPKNVPFYVARPSRYSEYKVTTIIETGVERRGMFQSSRPLGVPISFNNNSATLRVVQYGNDIYGVVSAVKISFSDIMTSTFGEIGLGFAPKVTSATGCQLIDGFSVRTTGAAINAILYPLNC